MPPVPYGQSKIPIHFPRGKGNIASAPASRMLQSTHLSGLVQTVVNLNICFRLVSQKMSEDMDDIKKNELKNRLTSLQWHVTQEKGTERPFTGCYNKFYEKGTYTCIVCDQELFSSETKYDSGCGWPAFNEVLDQGKIKLTKDTSNGKKINNNFEATM
ncbi:hypothetical protein PV325_009850 [Microctonus aethiopoides]|nr:hypothetical protein PV325_009850 [Microctonus aethiopoides]KAK0080710.1 hypothetical protein PV326_008025 [Microctonus aethiopoides]